MQTYETLFITSPVLAEDEEKSTVELLAGIITDGGGTIVANHPSESGVSSTMSSAKWQCTATRPEGSDSNRLTAYALCLAVP